MMDTLTAEAIDSTRLEIDPRIVRSIENADHVILSGASSAGKSTFLYALRESNPERFYAYQPVIPANWIAEGMQNLPSKSLFHINMHRPIYARMQSRPEYLYSNAAAPVTYEEYASEPVFKQFCTVAHGKVIALILLTPQAELVRRITERAVVEPRFEDSSKPYDNRTWSWVAKLQDMGETLSNWLKLLEEKHIEPVFVDSRDGKFVLLETIEDARRLVEDGQFRLTEDDINQIWSHEPFEYQRLSELVEVNAKFDVVLFLNVIHHLREPMRALELLSKITAKRLYLEFPTLTDHKFLSTISLGFWSKLLNQLPLIGVSLEDEAGQTFVFSRSAIERILVRNSAAFSRVEFIQSHIPDRLIAICHK